MLVRNFGNNVRFTPTQSYTPRNEDEVLALLAQHKKGRIRTVGSLHAWSEVAETEDVLVDLRLFDWVAAPVTDEQGTRVTVGAGCTIHRLMQVLREKASLTLPTVGTVMKQTVSGAISTATHGSGCSSLSHYVTAIRVAAYDRAGRPVIYDWYGGQALRAARCGIGCTGIILSVTFRCVPIFDVSERVRTHDSIEPVLSAAAEHPLEEFAIIPHRWTYVAYQRREAKDRPTGLKRVAGLLYRAYKWAVVDCFFHAALKLALTPRLFGESCAGVSNRLVRLLYSGTALLIGPAKVLTGERGVVDRNDRQLTRKHYYFQHVEMEVFVRREHVVDATKVLKVITQVFAGEPVEISDVARTALDKAGLLDRLESLRGRYLHHYPLYVRRVLRDDTLMSMTSGDREGTEYHAIGIFCYLWRRQRRGYFEYAGLIAFVMMRAFGARLHWGKYVPTFPDASLTYRDVEPLYPNLSEFRHWCRSVDPRGVFANGFARRVLGFAQHCTEGGGPSERCLP